MSSVTGDGLPIMCFAKLRACFFGPLISCHESWGDWSLSVSLTVKWVSTLSCHKWVLEGLSGWSGILDLLIILLLRPAGRHLSESPPHSLTKFISVPSPLLHQLSKEGVLLDGHHWNLLAHHPEGRQANTFICHSKTVLSCCWPLDASRNVMRNTKGLVGKYNGQLGINRPIQKCVLVWKLSVRCQFPRGVVDGRHPKCFWVQTERPLTNQSNETCDLWQVGTALGPFSSRKKKNGGLVTNFHNNLKGSNRKSWLLTGVCLTFLSLDRLSDWTTGAIHETSSQTHSILDQRSWLACREICLDGRMARGHLVGSPSYKKASIFE